MSDAAPVFLVLGPPLPDSHASSPAAELFRRAERALRDAPTLRVRYGGVAEGGPEGPLRFSGRLALGRDDVRLYMAAATEEARVRVDLSSDGLEQRTRVRDADGSEMHLAPADPRLRDVLLGGVARGGLLLATRALEEPDRRPRGDELFRVSGLRLREPTEVGHLRCHVLSYRLRVAGGPPATARLWLDVETNLPVRRSLVVPRPHGPVGIIEAYLDVDPEREPWPVRGRRRITRRRASRAGGPGDASP